MVKIESKEKLAKLLAIEDLDIQHQQVETAMFDIKNRCLILPIWKDIPNHLYDLFVGHEVGHALFTPTSPKRLKNIIEKTSKDCVNVIEDARIEALIKRRYPGLKKQFYNGYNNLIERDFFGLSKRDINKSGFLDRINIFFNIRMNINCNFLNIFKRFCFLNSFNNFLFIFIKDNLTILRYFKENIKSI